MRQREKDILNELSKEQLIYLIDQMRHSLCLIGETCVEESKLHIDSDEAVDKIRNYIYDMPSLYNAIELKAYIDMRMGNLSIEEYRKFIGLE